MVSWGVPLCIGRENSPSIYAKISALIDWINNQVWNFASIHGSNAICINSTNTYTIRNIPSFITTTWTSSSGVQITSRRHSRATIRTNGYPGDCWVRVTLSNGVVLTKSFNVISPPSYTYLGIYGNNRVYNNRWNSLGATYNGRLNNLNSYGYTWQWRVPASAVRNSSRDSWISFRPNTNSSSIYISVRACNECGCSAWRGY